MNNITLTTIYNCITDKHGKEKVNKRPYISKFFLDKEGKVEREFLRAAATEYHGAYGCKVEDNQYTAHYEVADLTPVAIGKNVDYSTYTTEEGMFVQGVWTPMTWFEIRDYLKGGALQAKARKEELADVPDVPEDTWADPFSDATPPAPDSDPFDPSVTWKP